MQEKSLLISSFTKENLATPISDMNKGKEAPPIEKPLKESEKLITLPKPNPQVILNNDLFSLIKTRRSRRKFLDTPLSLEELSYLLWATQGVERTFEKHPVTFRTVPSAGAKHPLETYLVIFNVTGLEQGLYRYSALNHALVFLKNPPSLKEELFKALLEVEFPLKASVLFIWTSIPYRTVWKYGEQSEKFILIDAGHVCQNLYLAAESILCGTCAMAAYSQTLLNQILELDEKQELALYLAPVGKK